MKSITIQVSDELASLAQGFAGFHGQTLESYVGEWLLSGVQADCEAHHHKSIPEYQAQISAEAATT